MKREQFEETLKADGWEQDRWGHLQKSITRRLPNVDYPIGQEPEITREYRVKLQATSCRIEVRSYYAATEYSPAKNEWVRIGGDYYGKIVQLDDGRIRVGSSFFGRRNK